MGDGGGGEESEAVRKRQEIQYQYVDQTSIKNAGEPKRANMLVDLRFALISSPG
jgi:hypothetical protein